MHRELYRLIDNDIESTIKGFIYNYMDLFKKIPESEKYTFELTNEIKEDFKKEFLKNNSGNPMDFLNWMLYNIPEEIPSEKKFNFILKFTDLFTEKE